MKKCPACDKTFDDSMKFCQIDGTPLVEDAAFDPFATIVGAAPPRPGSEPVSEASPQPDEDAPAISEPDDLLDLPDADPLRTMYASDEEMKAALQSDTEAPQSEIIDLPLVTDISSEETLVDKAGDQQGYGESKQAFPDPEPPSFKMPDVPAPSFGDMSPPPSPFSPGSSADQPLPPPSFDEPATGAPKFNEAETIIQGGYTNPFEAAPTAPVAEWTPPPAPVSSWENQSTGSEVAYTPSAAPMAAGQNKTLAIISLVTGILGVTICCGGLLPSLAAIVTGIMARSKASQNPSEFGGAGMAMAGIITGVIGLLGGIVVLVFWLLGTFANLATGNF